MKRDAIFNTRRRKLLRNVIPASEGAVGIAVIALLLGVVGWVLAQREAYNPESRDLPIALLEAERPAIEIYKRPLKPWIEPGTELAAGAPAAALTPYPENVADDEWRPTGRVRAFGPDNLYEKINGEAEKFLKQGFVSMHYLVLRDAESGAELAIELYDQGGVGGASGIFADHAGGGRAIAERSGVTYFLTTAGVIGRTGRWFFRAAADRSDDAVSAKAERLVDALATLDGAALAGAGAPTETAGTPPGLSILLRAGIPEAATEYQASNVFQFDFASDFWFARLDGTGETRVFVHVADSVDAARALEAAIIEEQSYDYAGLRTGENATVMRHSFLGTWFAIAREGRILFGAQNVAEEDAIRPALGVIGAALEPGEAARGEDG